MSIYECRSCNFSTKNRALFARHEVTLKHKANVMPELKEELSRLKREEFEAKQKLKEEEMELKRMMKASEAEMKYETKVKEVVLKEKLKELKAELKQAPEEDTNEEFVHLYMVEQARPLKVFMEKVINNGLDDNNAHDIHNNVTTLEEAFLRDVRNEFALSKSIVITPLSFYYKNETGAWTYTREGIYQGPINFLKTLPNLYHKYLKETFTEYNIPDMNVDMDEFMSIFTFKGVVTFYDLKKN